MIEAQGRVIGSCSKCGGAVSVPSYWHSVKPPVPRCQKCGASANMTVNLPKIPMK